jgi:hypothetical protein
MKRKHKSKYLFALLYTQAVFGFIRRGRVTCMRLELLELRLKERGG